jgi:hypothetical protein
MPTDTSAYYTSPNKAVIMHVTSLVSEAKKERECCCKGETLFSCTAKPERPSGTELSSTAATYHVEHTCSLPREGRGEASSTDIQL